MKNNKYRYSSSSSEAVDLLIRGVFSSVATCSQFVNSRFISGVVMHRYTTSLQLSTFCSTILFSPTVNNSPHSENRVVLLI